VSFIWGNESEWKKGKLRCPDSSTTVSLCVCVLFVGNPEILQMANRCFILGEQ